MHMHRHVIVCVPDTIMTEKVVLIPVAIAV